LYSWAAAMNGAYSSDSNPGDVQGVCPEGWHLPSDSEWKQMELYLGMNQSDVNLSGYRGLDEGGKMKLSGTEYWNSPNTKASNESGFSALPGGQRYFSGDAFYNLGVSAYFWTATSGEEKSKAWHRVLNYGKSQIDRNYRNKMFGFSVRCIKGKVTIQLPSVITSSVSDISVSSAQSGGEILSDGGSAIVDKGLCWSTSQYPTIYNLKTSNSNGTGIFSGTMEGLECYTSYFVRAYATNSKGTAYGSQIEFTTSECAPTVSTFSLNSINDTTAWGGGEVISDGGSTVIARGVCWSISQNPTIDDGCSIDGSGMGTFSSFLTELECGTTYYVRAYATNAMGTAYGLPISFNTSVCPVYLPTISTVTLSEITDHSAKVVGEVISDGGAFVTARGVCWSESPNPTISDYKTINGSGEGNYVSPISGLDPSTAYYVKLYATNSAGTQYSTELSFKTWAGSVVDIDGNIYYSVVIGEQTWMQSNLNVTHYADGTPLLVVNENSIWESMSIDQKACGWMDNNPDNGEFYGALYTWNASTNGGSSSSNPSYLQGICPSGWHLPSDVEWKQLELYLGMSQEEVDDISYRGTDEGGKLKETGSDHWHSYNTEATNETGFTARGAGHRNSSGSFGDFHNYGDFWTATEESAFWAWERSLFAGGAQIIRNDGYKKSGSSVRCVKD